MTIKPILMSPDMVRANLKDLKTETRRVIRDQPNHDSQIGGAEFVDGKWCWLNGHDGSIVRLVRHAPKHAPGDKLYIREAWRTPVKVDSYAPRELSEECSIYYDADIIDLDKDMGKFRQGMHMPRWASRMYLEVKEVTIESLHSITPAGCRAEGYPDGHARGLNQAIKDEIAMEWYHSLWDDLNHSRGFGWDKDPWVSVTKYQVVKQNVDEVVF